MTIKSSRERLNLKFIISDGLVDGKEKFRSKLVGRVKNQASDQGLYTVGSLLEDLQTKEIASILKVEESRLYEE